MRMNLDYVASGNFVPGRDVLCEFADYWPLVLSTVGLVYIPLLASEDILCRKLFVAFEASNC